MNCDECQTNYYMNDDTKSCYLQDIDNYYKNPNTMKFVRCHANCLRCTTTQNSNCIKCINNYYMKEADHSCHENIMDHFYYDFSSKTLKPCHPNCLRCYSAATNEDYMNCLSCSDGLFMTEDTKSCYSSKDNYYKDTSVNPNKLRRCHPNCLTCSSAPSDENHMNCLTCQNNYHLTEDTNSCYTGDIDNYYLDNTENKYKKCHQDCLTCSNAPLDDNHMNCLTCQKDYFITVDTNSCYNELIDNYYLDFENKRFKNCHQNCLRCTWAPIDDHMNCITCKSNFYLTEDTNSCYDYTPDNYYLDTDVTPNKLRRCFHNCDLCSGAPESYFSQNCLTCKEDYYMTEDTNSCFREPLKDYYFDVDIFRRCNNNCLFCYDITNDETLMNCLKCYDDLLTRDRNTCYDYIIKNAINFYDITGIPPEDIYYTIPMDDHFLKFTTNKYLKNNIDPTQTSINLGNCENILKEAYGIPLNDPLYYIIVDVAQEGMKVPKVEYDVYYLNSDNEYVKLDFLYVKEKK